MDTRLAGGTGGKTGESEILLAGVAGVIEVATWLTSTLFIAVSSSLIWVGGGGGGGLELVVPEDGGLVSIDGDLEGTKADGVVMGLLVYRLGVMYRGALGIRLFRGLFDSGWGILDGVCLGDVAVEMVVEEIFEMLAGEGNFVVGFVILL